MVIPCKWATQKNAIVARARLNSSKKFRFGVSWKIIAPPFFGVKTQNRDWMPIFWTTRYFSSSSSYYLFVLLVIIIIDIFSFFFHVFENVEKKNCKFSLLSIFDLRIASQTDRKRIGMTCGWYGRGDSAKMFLVREKERQNKTWERPMAFFFK